MHTEVMSRCVKRNWDEVARGLGFRDVCFEASVRRDKRDDGFRDRFVGLRLRIKICAGERS